MSACIVLQMVKPVAKSPSAAADAKSSDGRTQPIADANGHLLPGVPKQAAAFVKPQAQAVRWPAANPTVKGIPAATMG